MQPKRVSRTATRIGKAAGVVVNHETKLKKDKKTGKRERVPSVKYASGITP